VVFKPVNFNPVPPPQSAEVESDHSFNESIDFASYRRNSRESLDDDVFEKVYSTDPENKMNEVFDAESLADSNFSNTLGDTNSIGGKSPGGDSLYTFFKDSIESKNPQLFHTINKILEEEQDDNLGSNDKAAIQKDRKHVPKSLGPMSQLNSSGIKQNISIYEPDQNNNSSMSLNHSEPSLLETSTDNSPIVPEISRSDQKKTKSFQEPLHPQSIPTPKEKAKSLYPAGNAANVKGNIDVSERSFFSEERSASSSTKRRGGLKAMSREGEFCIFTRFWLSDDV
jgi:hypothetical protein